MTTRRKHSKHPPLARTSTGMYSKNEWAIYGTTCSRIATVVDQLSTLLAPDHKAVYVDADHSEEELSTAMQIGKKRWSVSEPLPWNSFDDKLLNWPSEVTFVNGNHYPATCQIVIIDDAKKDSLLRRVDQLTDIDIVVADGKEAIYDSVKERMTPDTLVVRPDQLEKVADHIREAILAKEPQLKALILAGGKSSRMQEDKSAIAYHGEQPHEHYIASLCQGMGLETYLSKGHTYTETTAYGLPVIKDKFVDMGPLGAILTAFMHDPDAAWLVLACDLPFIDTALIQQLVRNRDLSKYGTAYKVADTSFPEPLMAIYEPRIYQRMLQFLSLGYACPRKVLINSDIHELELVDSTKAYNANTPEEKQKAQELLKSK